MKATSSDLDITNIVLINKLSPPYLFMLVFPRVQFYWCSYIFYHWCLSYIWRKT